MTNTGIVIPGSGTIYANSGVIGAGTLTGTLSTANQYNVTNLGTLGNLAVTSNANVGNINVTGSVYANSGTVKGQYLYGDGSNITGIGGAGYIYNGTSNIGIPLSGGNVYFTVGLTANVLTISNNSANLSGNANISGFANVASLNATGNVSASNVIATTGFIGNLSGTANLANTVVGSAQPNITSLGTLDSLTVAGIADLGTVTDIRIGGGGAGYFLTTDGSGNLSWQVPSSGSGGGGGGGTSLKYTAGASPPASANVLGDQWYDTASGVLYEFINDGTSSFWIDVSSDSTSTAIPTTLNLDQVLISGGSNGQVLTSNGAGGLTFNNLTQANIYNGNSNVIVSENSNVTFNVSGINNVLTITSTGANLLANKTANLGNLVTANYVTGVLTTTAQPNVTSLGTLSNLAVSGQMVFGVSVKNISIKTNVTSVVTYDISQTGTFYHTTPSSNFVPNFTNVTASDNKAIDVLLMIEQRSTPYVPTALQIGGFLQTVKWGAGVSAPTGNANKTDVITYTVMKVSGNWVVLGSYTYYG